MAWARVKKKQAKGNKTTSSEISEIRLVKKVAFQPNSKLYLHVKLKVSNVGYSVKYKQK